MLQVQFQTQQLQHVNGQLDTAKDEVDQAHVTIDELQQRLAELDPNFVPVSVGKKGRRNRNRGGGLGKDVAPMTLFPGAGAALASGGTLGSAAVTGLTGLPGVGAMTFPGQNAESSTPGAQRDSPSSQSGEKATVSAASKATADPGMPARSSAARTVTESTAAHAAGPASPIMASLTGQSAATGSTAVPCEALASAGLAAAGGREPADHPGLGHVQVDGAAPMDTRGTTNSRKV
jgi:hypothetical protein